MKSKQEKLKEIIGNCPLLEGLETVLCSRDCDYILEKHNDGWTSEQIKDAIISDIKRIFQAIEADQATILAFGDSRMRE